jgi:hypothetical protein
MNTEHEHEDSRRSFLKKAAYTAPVILTLKADPAFASYGSGKPSGEEPVKEAKPWKNETPGNGKAGKDEKPGKDKQAKGNNGVGNGVDPAPPGNPRVNDGPGTRPSHPRNKH